MGQGNIYNMDDIWNIYRFIKDFIIINKNILTLL